MKILAVGEGKSNTSKVVKQMVDNDLQIIIEEKIKKKSWERCRKRIIEDK